MKWNNKLRLLIRLKAGVMLREKNVIGYYHGGFAPSSCVFLRCAVL
jgi:hypothetical protein